MAAHESTHQSSLRAVINHRGKWHRHRKHARARLRLHARPERSEPSPSFRFHASSSSVLAVKVEGTAGGIAGCRRDKLHLGYTEFDLLRRWRAVVGRGIVVEGECPLSSRTVSLLHHRSDCHGVANKGPRVARADDRR